MYARKLTFAVLAALVACVGCAKNNTDTKPTDTTTGTGTKMPEATGKPEELIIGKWRPAQPGDTTIDWTAFSSGEPAEAMRFKKGGQLEFTTKNFVQEARYEFHEGNLKVVSTVTFQPIGGPASKPPAPPMLNLTFKVTGDELVVTDEKGKAQKFTRAAISPGKVKITGLPICCAGCGVELKKELAKDAGISDINIDVKSRTVTCNIKDGDVTDGVQDALKRAGMHGNIVVEGQRGRLSPFTTVTGYLGDPPTEIVLSGVHACCPSCTENLSKLFPAAKVTVAGAGSVKTVTITGKALDINQTLEKLKQAGYECKLESKK